jgi:hypothetical protein
MQQVGEDMEIMGMKVVTSLGGPEREAGLRERGGKVQSRKWEVGRKRGAGRAGTGGRWNEEQVQEGAAMERWAGWGEEPRWGKLDGNSRMVCVCGLEGALEKVQRGREQEVLLWFKAWEECREQRLGGRKARVVLGGFQEGDSHFLL